eukprot:g42081.t1
MPVGVNLPPITSDFPYVFKDLFKHSRVWNLDRWAFDQLRASIHRSDKMQRHILLQVVQAVGIRVRLTSTNASDYVRNIRLLRVADEASYSTQPFSPVLLSLLEGFDIIRFSRVQGMSSSTCSYPTNAEKAQICHASCRTLPPSAYRVRVLLLSLGGHALTTTSFTSADYHAAVPQSTFVGIPLQQIGCVTIDLPPHMTRKVELEVMKGNSLSVTLASNCTIGSFLVSAVFEDSKLLVKVIVIQSSAASENRHVPVPMATLHRSCDSEDCRYIVQVTIPQACTAEYCGMHHGFPVCDELGERSVSFTSKGRTGRDSADRGRRRPSGGAGRDSFCQRVLYWSTLSVSASQSATASFSSTPSVSAVSASVSSTCSVLASQSATSSLSVSASQSATASVSSTPLASAVSASAFPSACPQLQAPAEEGSATSSSSSGVSVSFTSSSSPCPECFITTWNMPGTQYRESYVMITIMIVMRLG